MFRYFNIRNSKISKYRSFYISSFQNLTPTLKCHMKKKATPYPLKEKPIKEHRFNKLKQMKILNFFKALTKYLFPRI